MEPNNGTKALWAVVLAAGTLIGNAGIWIVNRLVQMDQDRAALSVQMGRMEAKLDELLREVRAPGRIGR